MKRPFIAVLAAALLAAGCGKSNSTPPPPDNTQPPPVAASYPFQEALIAGGFSVRDTKITHGNTATVEPHDGTKCTVVLEASEPSLDTYRVTKVAGKPVGKLPPALQAMFNRDNIKEDDLWAAIKAQRDAGNLHC